MTPANVPRAVQSYETVPVRQGFLSWIFSFVRPILGWPADGDTPRVPQSKSSDTVPSNGNDISQSPSIPWQHIDKPYLDSILTTREGFEMATKLQGSDATSIVNLLDVALDSENLTRIQGKRYFALQRKLCGNCGILPTSCMIMEGLEQVGNFPVAGGGFSDVLEGTLKGRKVAIKDLRMHMMDEPIKLKKRFCKEAIIWKRLSHPNILQFIGIANPSSQLSLVSPWMENGTINTYIKNNPQDNRLHLLKDVVDGLKYLHSKSVVHGNLKGRNILIKVNGRACLADFGLTMVTSATISGHQTSDSGGTLRWMAPELLVPEEFGLQECVPSKESDIYAFGMVVYEVVTGYFPFAPEVVRNEEVIAKVIRGDRPTNLATTNLVEVVWPIAEKCWCQVARDRLPLPQVSEILEVEISKWKQEEQPRIELNTQYANDDDSDSEMIGQLYQTVRRV